MNYRGIYVTIANGEIRVSAVEPVEAKLAIKELGQFKKEISLRKKEVTAQMSPLLTLIKLSHINKLKKS